MSTKGAVNEDVTDPTKSREIGDDPAEANLQPIRLAIGAQAERSSQRLLDDLARAVWSPIGMTQKRLNAVEIDARRIGGEFEVASVVHRSIAAGKLSPRPLGEGFAPECLAPVVIPPPRQESQLVLSHARKRWRWNGQLLAVRARLHLEGIVDRGDVLVLADRGGELHQPAHAVAAEQ